MQQVKEFKGEFEIQNKPETRRTGQLKIAENGSWRLDITGAFSEGDKIYEPTIVGSLNDGKYASILTPSYRRKCKKGIGEPDESILRGQMVYVGPKAINSKDELNIKELKLELFDCDIWFCENHVHASQQYVSPLLHKYVSPLLHKCELQYDEHTVIEVKSVHNFTLSERTTAVNIKSSESKTLSHFQEAIYQLMTFISFAIAKAVKQGHITAIDEQDKEYSIYYQPAFYPVESSVGTNPVLFCYHFSKLQQVFDRWGSIIQSEDSKILSRLYFLPFLNKMDAVIRYVVRSQLLESMHAKLNQTGRVHFIERVRQIVKHTKYIDLIAPKLLEEEEIEPLCQLIKDTRNYYTHYSNDDGVAKDSDLIFLCMRVELLIDLFLLQHLGFEKEDFDKIADVVIADRFNRQQIMAKYK